MKQEFRRALRKEKQYLTPLQRGVFMVVGLTFMAAEVTLVTGAIQGHHYRLLWLAIPMVVLFGWGAAMISAAIRSSPEYRPKN